MQTLHAVPLESQFTRQALRRQQHKRCQIKRQRAVVSAALSEGDEIFQRLEVLHSRGERRNLLAVVRAAEGIKAGELSSSIDSDARHEIGDLLRAIGGMQRHRQRQQRQMAPVRPTPTNRLHARGTSDLDGPEGKKAPHGRPS